MGYVSSVACVGSVLDVAAVTTPFTLSSTGGKYERAVSLPFASGAGLAVGGNLDLYTVYWVVALASIESVGGSVLYGSSLSDRRLYPGVVYRVLDGSRALITGGVLESVISTGPALHWIASAGSTPLPFATIPQTTTPQALNLVRGGLYGGILELWSKVAISGSVSYNVRRLRLPIASNPATAITCKT